MMKFCSSASDLSSFGSLSSTIPNTEGPTKRRSSLADACMALGSRRTHSFDDKHETKTHITIGNNEDVNDISKSRLEREKKLKQCRQAFEEFEAQHLGYTSSSTTTESKGLVADRWSEPHPLGYNTSSTERSNNNKVGMVANRKSKLTRRLSMDYAIDSKKPSTAVAKRLSLSTSMDSAAAPSGELDLNDLKLGSSHQTRFNAMRERFNNSRCNSMSSSWSSGMDSSLDTLDTNNSYLNGSMNSIPENDLSLTDSEENEDEDDQSLTSVGSEEPSESFHYDDSTTNIDISTKSLDLNSLTSSSGEELEVHEAGLQKLMDMEHCFNVSFLHIGSGMDCRQTRKGSVYVMGDEKFGKTQIVKTKLDKAARTIQRFFRYTQALLSRVRQEIEYWQDELKDIERRRAEELEDVLKFLEVEKQQFALQLEEESLQKLVAQVKAQHKVLDGLEEEVQSEKDESAKLTESIRFLTRENQELTTQAADPIQADKVKLLEREIKLLTAKKNQREEIVSQAKKTAALIGKKTEKVGMNLRQVLSHNQRIKESIRKVVNLGNANLDKFEPKHTKKVKKRMDKAAAHAEGQKRKSSSSTKGPTSAERKINKQEELKTSSKSCKTSVGVFPENKSRSLTRDSQSSLQRKDGESSAGLSLVSNSKHDKTTTRRTPQRTKSSLQRALEESKLKKAKDAAKSKKKRSSDKSPKRSSKSKSGRSQSQPEGTMARRSLIKKDLDCSSHSSKKDRKSDSKKSNPSISKKKSDGSTSQPQGGMALMDLIIDEKSAAKKCARSASQPEFAWHMSFNNGDYSSDYSKKDEKKKKKCGRSASQPEIAWHMSLNNIDYSSDHSKQDEKKQSAASAGSALMSLIQDSSDHSKKDEKKQSAASAGSPLMDIIQTSNHEKKRKGSSKKDKSKRRSSMN